MTLRAIALLACLACACAKDEDPCPGRHVEDQHVEAAVAYVEDCAGIRASTHDWVYCVGDTVDGGIACRAVRPTVCQGQTWGWERVVWVTPSMAALAHEVLHTSNARLLWDVDHLEPEWEECGL